MIPQWQTGIVRRIIQETHNTRRYWIELPETPVFDFKPGQFVTLDLPIDEQRNKRWRSYSIASAPDGTNSLELLIVHVDGGRATEYIFHEITVGSKLVLRGPQGAFTLPPALDKELFLICTGTGIAPFRSMVYYVRDRHIAFHKINLVFGTRHRDDLLYDAELRRLEAELPGFSYYPTLSRQQWEGRTGYVHPVYEELCAARPPATFMLCGWRQMIDEANARIKAMGYTQKDILSELYG